MVCAQCEQRKIELNAINSTVKRIMTQVGRQERGIIKVSTKENFYNNSSDSSMYLRQDSMHMSGVPSKQAAKKASRQALLGKDK